MPTHTVTIPTTTVHPGTPQVFGPVTTNQSLTSTAITIDRTVAGGLNSVSQSVIFHMQVDLSFDNGVTFTPWSSDTTTGGFVPDDLGNPETTQIDNITFNPPIPHKTQGRLTITVTNSPVVVAGSASLTD